MRGCVHHVWTHEGSARKKKKKDKTRRVGLGWGERKRGSRRGPTYRPPLDRRRLTHKPHTEIHKRLHRRIATGVETVISRQDADIFLRDVGIVDDLSVADEEEGEV